MGEARSKQKITFTPDTGTEGSPARTRLAAIDHEGLLNVHHATDLPKEFEATGPFLLPVPANLGSGPAICMAIDLPDTRPLSHHGFYFKLLSEAKTLLAHLHHETWYPISIKGERGTRYAHESAPTTSEETGRYRYRRGRIEIEPAQK